MFDAQWFMSDNWRIYVGLHEEIIIHLYSNYADMHAYISKHKNIMLEKLTGLDTIDGFYDDMCTAYDIACQQ